MRSYYSHLQSTAAQNQAPVLRASAIFPVFQNNLISTRLIFLSYWLLKRRIEKISTTITLRTEKGIVTKQISILIQEPKAYQIEVKDLIGTPFFGSIEIEFLSTEDLVFPYPAVSVNYYGKTFSTVVHTASRIYNDEADKEKNSETHVPESGFNVYADDNRISFLTMINGKDATAAQDIHFCFYNTNGETLLKKQAFEPFLPFQTKLIYLDNLELQSFLKKKAGTCKIDFSLKGVFPRLLVGNQMKNPFSQVITHTYYDCSKACSPSNFWTPSDPDWHSATLMLPLMGGQHTTTLSFYPILSPSPFQLDFEIYNQKGEKLQVIQNGLSIEAPFEKFIQLSLDSLYPSDEPLAIKVIARPHAEIPIPARIKIALDIGVKNKGLPCNICTNLQTYLPAFKDKKTSFKWAPLLADQPKSFAFIMNSSPEITMKRSTEVDLTFYRQSDCKTMKRHLNIPPQGFHFIYLSQDEELQKFFQGQVGWFTAISSNPYLTTYYFAENPSGTIGGDHGF